MDRRSSFAFEYDRSELFFPQRKGTDRRAFLTNVDRYETVVGARVWSATEITFYWLPGFGLLPVEIAATLVGVTLTLCDERKVPYIEGLPANRLNAAHIKAQSVLAGATASAGSQIPLKLEPRRTSIGASYIADYRGDLNLALVELFFLGK